MQEREEVIREMRHLYAPIYDWHRKSGKETYLFKHRDSANSEGEWFRKYLNLCQRMPAPRHAEPDQMLEVAQAVISGCMEWACCTQLGNTSMFQIAQRIRELRKMFDKLQRDEHLTAERDRLRGLSNRSHEPQTLRIRLPRSPETPEEYAELASLAYSDVPTNVANLGGNVALADTNRHHEDALQREQHGEGAILTFRNASALHLEEVSTPDSLVAHALSGAVSIMSVKIGV